MPSAYLETSFFRYLVAPASRNTLKATRQQVTRKWWQDLRGGFDLCVSQMVYEEFCLPEEVPPGEVRQRFALLQQARILPLAGEILEVAGWLIQPVGPLPRVADVDAIHWAVAAYYRCDYLITWNFKHLNNALVKRQAERILRAHAYESPTICSPEELVGPAAG